MGAEAVIPSNRRPHDAGTRHDRRTIHFNGVVHLAAAMIRLR